ncbi:branched-chain amino acid ABC transporter ATP-binding protein [Alicycliphilus denitrificans]|uniref:ABC transporter ATP-binding protein n=1 Tax=Alicycliphilus denitrificans TaxID=179636 RepID=UPI0009592892|nr:ABC transporter ATP-binding protein [Alicycliphilus denitrificans]MBN9576002.1 ABC transporter ATP-binding protein [Alicycliphilus denitrificans]OJW89093.1 MAG: ABC transporter ATP-binding protein [Alicycliphilus sp. 69-12]BCN40874.1 branched-chain amino acid ABC transporter ATP-binding protein [Alicycliphilus denitrificans]
MLELRNISAFYGDSLALNGISLQVRPRQGVAILGRNGAGKSTLFKSIVGGGPAVQGEILLDGQPLARRSTHERIRAGIAFVPEDRRIFPHLTVEENLEIARHGARPGHACHEAQQSYQLFPLLADLKERMGTQLSGGQQQILAVARGMVARPQYLLLDEPTEGVAPLIVQQMAEQIGHACAQEGIALVVAEQNVWFARQCSEYVYVMDTGQVVFEGTWEDYDANPQVAEKYLAI